MRRSLVLPALLVTLIPALALAAPTLPAPAPAPTPAPAPGPAPTTSPTPGPAGPGPAPVPAASTSPAPAPDPAASPEPGPAPDPATSSPPVAAPEPAPAPAPGPEPAPASSPDPAASAAPPTGPASNSPPPLAARHRLVYSNLLVLRVNPLGAEDRFTLGYSYRLYNKTSALFRDAYIGVAFSPTFSPSITRIGASLDIAPLTILRFRAGYYLSTWYGSHRFKAHPFHSPHDEYGPNTLKERADMKLGINTLGGQAELGVLFQIKGGPVALRDELIAYNNNIRLPNEMGGKQYDVFYDLRHDVLVPAKGWFLTNDTDLLYVTKFGLAAGVRNSLVHVFYPEAVFEPTDDKTNPNTPMDRFGPLISYVVYDRPQKRFNKPTIFLAAQWWLKHRYRAQGGGGEVNQGIPLVLLGFAFSGDLVRSKD